MLVNIPFVPCMQKGWWNWNSHQSKVFTYTFWSLELRWPNMNPVYLYIIYNIYIYLVICSLTHEWKLCASRKMESSFPNLWGEQKFNEQKVLNNLRTGEQTWNKKTTPGFYNEPWVKTWQKNYTKTHKPPPKVLFHTLTKPYSEIKAFCMPTRNWSVWLLVLKLHPLFFFKHVF